MTGEKRICEGFLCEGDRKTSETGWVPLYNGTNADLAARAARRASYAAIDQDAASKQIEELLMKNVAEAKKVAFLSGANQFISEPTLLWPFYLNVKKNAVMDYKNQINWSKSLPGLPYPEGDQVYSAFGVDISSSDLGNLNYAMVGKALGIPETLLLQQAGAAELRDHGEWDIVSSQFESIRQKNNDYGDQTDDQNMIKSGFELYNLIND